MAIAIRITDTQLVILATANKIDQTHLKININACMPYPLSFHPTVDTTFSISKSKASSIANDKSYTREKLCGFRRFIAKVFFTNALSNGSTFNTAKIAKVFSALNKPWNFSLTQLLSFTV